MLSHEFEDLADLNVLRWVLLMQAAAHLHIRNCPRCLPDEISGFHTRSLRMTPTAWGVYHLRLM